MLQFGNFKFFTLQDPHNPKFAPHSPRMRKRALNILVQSNNDHWWQKIDFGKGQLFLCFFHLIWPQNITCTETLSICFPQLYLITHMLIILVSTESSKRIYKHLHVVLICNLSHIYSKDSSLFSKMVAIRSQPHVSVQAMVRPQFRLVVNHPHSLVDILYIIFLYYLYTLSYIRAR